MCAYTQGMEVRDQLTEFFSFHLMGLGSKCFYLLSQGGSPGPGVIELNPGPLQEKLMLLTMESSPQPHIILF